MIPPFDPDTGALPPGIHPASWAEVMDRFGVSSHRHDLLLGLRRALDALEAAGCRQVYLDGSFVTTKDKPGDVDVAWDSRGVDRDRLFELAPVLFDSMLPRRRQRELYGGDYFIAAMVADGRNRSFLEFFQYDRHTGALKGIVAIQLGGEA